MRTILNTLIVVCLLSSCKKEETTQPMPTNKAPVANAGTDAFVNIPETRFTLNGEGSYDPDNTYIEYTWRQISGPTLLYFQENKNKKIAAINISEEGLYAFELKVNDLPGLSDLDTMMLTVVDNFAIGKAPVINLSCKSYMLPTYNSNAELVVKAHVVGDPGQRFDIRSGFSVRQIQGPSASLIQQANYDFNGAAFPISNLVKGTYQFQVEVSRKGIIAVDTAIISVVDDTLQGKEYIFETKWEEFGAGVALAKTPEKLDFFYASSFRGTEVFVSFEGSTDWHQVDNERTQSSWLIYSNNACNSNIEVIMIDDLIYYVIGKKVKIKVRYL